MAEYKTFQNMGVADAVTVGQNENKVAIILGLELQFQVNWTNIRCTSSLLSTLLPVEKYRVA